MAETIALTERLIYLRTVPVLRTLPPGVLMSVARTLTPRAFQKGDVLLREDELGASVFMMISGRARLSRKGVSLGVLEAPNAVGFLPLLAHVSDGFQVVADAPTRALEADADAIFELLEDQFDLMLVALQDVARLLSKELKRDPARIFGQPLPEPKEIPDRPLDVVERIFELRRMAPFRTSSIDALAVFSRSLVEERLEAGHLVWRSGDPSGETLLIVAGTLRVRDRDGAELGAAGAGTTVGGLESMAGHARWFDLYAESPTVILRGRTSSLLEVFEDNHDMARDFLAFTTATLIHIWDERVASGGPTESIIDDMRSLQIYGGGPHGPRAG